MESETKHPSVYSTVLDGVCTITLNRPSQLNAIDLDLANNLLAAINVAEERADVHVLVLTGAGKAFCAGGDVRAMAIADDAPAFLTELTGALHQSILKLSSLGKPIIAVVDGVAAGAGIGLMLTADVIIASERATFVAAYSRIGLTPDAGTSTLVPAAIGMQRSLDFFLNARTMSDTDALAWGLVNRVVSSDEVDAAALRQAQQFAAGAHGALGEARRLLRSEINRQLQTALPDESATIAEQSGTVTSRRLVADFVGGK